MVYFIKATQSGAIKIGVSNDPRKRLDAMQTGSAEPLELLGVIPGQQDAERRLHERFQKFRIHGEWFRGDQELVAAINILLLPSIAELIDRTGAKLWYIRGRFFGDTEAFSPVLCVCRGCCEIYPPDVDAMLGVIFPGETLAEIDCIVDATKRENLWPGSPEAMRLALTDDDTSTIWVADASELDEFVRISDAVAKELGIPRECPF